MSFFYHPVIPPNKTHKYHNQLPTSFKKAEQSKLPHSSSMTPWPCRPQSCAKVRIQSTHIYMQPSPTYHIIASPHKKKYCHGHITDDNRHPGAHESPPKPRKPSTSISSSEFACSLPKFACCQDPSSCAHRGKTAKGRVLRWMATDQSPTCTSR